MFLVILTLGQLPVVVDHTDNKRAIYACATLDTKREEILFLADCARAAGAQVRIVDVSTGASCAQGADINRATVAACHPQGGGAVLDHSERGQAIGAMAEALANFVLEEYTAGRLAGIVGIGGGGGTSLVTQAMRQLPLGVPKLMLSTLASGNVGHYVDCSDITMMHSVVDIAGLNRISRAVLRNAAHAITGMVAWACEDRAAPVGEKPATAITMFGVTTPCVDAVRAVLEQRDEACRVFHATGSGGRTMEYLVAADCFNTVLDITTTEVADEVVGGVLSAGPGRMDTIVAAGLPYVVSLGALDMVNFAGMESVPARFRHRTLHVHNSEVTLMRTTASECRDIARWIAAKLNRAKAPVRVLIPEGGVSMLDAPGQPFYDPQANEALFSELEQALAQDELRQLIRLPFHINDPAFAEAILAQREALLVVGP